MQLLFPNSYCTGQLVYQCNRYLATIILDSIKAIIMSRKLLYQRYQQQLSFQDNQYLNQPLFWILTRQPLYMDNYCTQATNILQYLSL